MTNGSNNNSLLSDINVTPFVDVMLVLLIIFMVTAPMMVQGIDVSLPEATSKTLVSDEEPLIITINRNNQIFHISCICPPPPSLQAGLSNRLVAIDEI